MTEVGTEEYRIGITLGLNPNDTADWPMDIIQKLLQIREQHGRERMFYEIGKLLGAR